MQKRFFGPVRLVKNAKTCAEAVQILQNGRKSSTLFILRKLWKAKSHARVFAAFTVFTVLQLFSASALFELAHCTFQKENMRGLRGGEYRNIKRGHKSKESKIEKNRIAAALSEKVCVYSIKEGKFAN